MPERPRILITIHGPEQRAREAPAWQTFAPYADAIRRAGGEPRLLDTEAAAADRAEAFESMDGLLLPGGADIDPARYGQDRDPRTLVEPGRDELEAGAWAAARRRRVPVFGVCRGMQAINVFSGGSLLQHVDGHDLPTWPSAEARPHSMRLADGSRLAAILALQPAEQVIEVNSYHHQAMRPDQLGAGLRMSGTTDDGGLVEAFEAADPDHWIFGVQSHPERPEFTPPAFLRLWRAFVEAAAR